MNVVLVNGSCRPPRSNTGAMAAFLQSALESRGASVTTLDVAPWRDGDPALPAEAAAAATACDVLVVLAPVYLDAVPAPTLRLLDHLRQARASKPAAPPAAAYAVIHSGYLEPAHQQAGLRQCRHFAWAAGLAWRGGLGFGGTSPIGGRPLADAGPFAKHVRPALDLLAGAIVAGADVPGAAVRLSHKSPIPLPSWLVVPLLNAMTRRDLKKRGVGDPLARPYPEGG